jgi:hypothetical protein
MIPRTNVIVIIIVGFEEFIMGKRFEIDAPRKTPKGSEVPEEPAAVVGYKILARLRNVFSRNCISPIPL